MDGRLEGAPVVLALAGALGDLVKGLYVGGSLAGGDYHPGVSDIDAVALLERAPSPRTRRLLVEVHERLVDEAQDGSALHCVYVPAGLVTDVRRQHWTWAFGELFRRPLSAIARAELLAEPITVVGPEPSTWLPPMSVDDLRDAARAELAGYWTRALRRRAIWLQDVYVDLGLTVWARAEATIDEGVLITKAEAVVRMAERGVPRDIVDGVARRRAGEQVLLTEEQRRQRAEFVRGFLTAQVSRLLHRA